MDKRQIAINTEAFLDYLDSDAGIRRALKEVKEMGYETVELWHVKGPENHASWAPFLKEAGLRCCAIHELYEEVMENVEGTISKAKDVGAEFLAIGRSRNTDWEDMNSIKDLAKGLNRLGKICRESGIRVLYHNHNTEFSRIGGKTGLEILFEETDAELVGSELDVYWVQLGGANPVTWCQMLKGRLGIVHLKDIGVALNTPDSFIKRPVCRAIGDGNLEITAIIAAAQKSGCEIFAIETCTDWKDNDSLRCARESLAYLESRKGQERALL